MHSCPPDALLIQCSVGTQAEIASLALGGNAPHSEPNSWGLLVSGLVVAVTGTLAFAAAAHATFEQFGNYLASGPVGFSVYLDHAQSVPGVWSAWRFFERTANYFGNYFDVPDSNAAFVLVGDGLYYNVYTAFFSHSPSYGVADIVVELARSAVDGVAC